MAWIKMFSLTLHYHCSDHKECSKILTLPSIGDHVRHWRTIPVYDN